MIQIGGLYFADGEAHFQRFGDQVADYQRPQREKAFEYVRDWTLALDIGANVGIFARHFAERFDRVIAVEPLPVNIECLRRNVPANVTIHQCAVGDECQDVQVYQPAQSTSGAFVANHAGVEAPPVKMKPQRLITVPMVTIDSFRLERLGLLKLDIQGSEAVALKGARETILRCKPVVLVEEKPVIGSTAHIDTAAALLRSYGMAARERVGADRVYVFE